MELDVTAVDCWDNPIAANPKCTTIPSFIGIDKEYFSSSMTSDEWEEFVASFKTDYGGKADEDLFNKYDTVVDELASWDKLSADKRITLLNKV